MIRPKAGHLFVSARMSDRVAALKAGLKLTLAQEKNWPALETAF
jgi:hypothetical protein